MIIDFEAINDNNNKVLSTATKDRYKTGQNSAVQHQIKSKISDIISHAP